MEYKKLPTDKIYLNPSNPRMGFSDNFSFASIDASAIKNKQTDLLHWFELTADDDVGEDKELGSAFSYHRSGLKDSIEAEGIKDPIKVQKLDKDNYLVVDGNTRLSIAKELNANNPDDNRFKTVPCLLISDYEDKEFHKLQLTQHVVGSKPWDIYCRAQYLHHLKVTNVMELNHILNICGTANKNRFKKEIASFEHMRKWKKVCEEDSIEPVEGINLCDWDTNKFSYFLEFQKKIKIFEDISYDEDDFTRHMRQNLIKKGADVRKLPEIWQNVNDPNNEVRKVFLKEGTQEAIKKLKEIKETELPDNVGLLNICKILDDKISDFLTEERITFLKENAAQKLETLSGTSENLIELIEDLERINRA